jgi:RNA polymerase sigma-70 factor (ECF subfamily)
MVMAPPTLKLSRDDPRQFGAFYRAEVRAVTRYFASRLVDPEAALDLTAETFAQAYAGRRRFRGDTEEEARGWLFKIAQNQLATYLRKGYAKRSALQRLGLERPAADSEELQRVEELGEMAALRTVIARQLEDPPDGLREAVRLRVVEQLDYDEVAQQLSITETAARMRVSRALKALRGTLSQHIPMET